MEKTSENQLSAISCQLSAKTTKHLVRVDLYLKLMGITKTRMVAKRLCDSGKVLLNSHPVKPAQEVLEGGSLEVSFPQREVRFRILAIPPAPSVAKKDRPQFMALESVKEL